MIRIERPKQKPDVLLDAGDWETRVNCERYEWSEDAYRSGAKKFNFKRNIYAHQAVKDALLRAQHKKCCYCESKFRANSPGAVEHFRPKGAVRRESGEGRLYPGYYWLAYSWNNLLVSCERCNSSHKGSLFPLADERKRSRSHHDDIGVETPLFIDPSKEDPRKHIRFERAAVAARTQKGRTTIAGLGLKRSDLEELRRDRLALIQRLTLIVKLGHILEPDQLAPTEVEEAQRLLDEAILSKAAYAAMARDFLDSNDDTSDGE